MSFRIVLISLILTLTSALNLLAQKENLREGNRLYRDGKYQEAEEQFWKAMGIDGNYFKTKYNLANSLYKQGRYDEAIDKYKSVSFNDIDKNIKSQTFYNLGNSYFMRSNALNKQIQELAGNDPALIDSLQKESNNSLRNSIEAYKNALRNNPDDAESKHNMEFVKKYLQQQEQNQQQQKNQNNQQNQNQNQNQNQQNKNEKDKNNQQNQEQQNEQEQNKDKQNKNEQKQQNEGISKEDAERMLKALGNDEKKMQEMMRKLLNNKDKTEKKKLEKFW